MSFDYGADPVESLSSKQPEVGSHMARVRSIIHCGPVENFYLGDSKGISPNVVVICELEGSDDFEDDGVTRLVLDKDMPLKTGDKATVQKFLKAVDPKTVCGGFDDVIGLPVMIDAVGGKEKDDKGDPKWVNLSAFSSVAKDFISMVPELTEEGVGHVTFANLTKEAILELHPIRHVNKLLMKSVAYEGSNAQKIIDEIKEANPDFAVPAKKDDDKKGPAKAEKNEIPDQEAPEMDAGKEY